MKTRKLGYTDIELTTVGLGTWAIGGSWEFGWGPQDDDVSIRTILTALDEGVNWIDTAAIYGCGHSEEIVGKALKQSTGQKPIIATKCGLRWNEKREKISCLKRESIRAECDESLKRLQVDIIDLYQIHWNQPEQDIEQAWDELARLQEQGKVRYIGVSNFTIEQMERIGKIAPVASLQPSYSMLHRQVEKELLGYCSDNNIGVIVYSPMQRGLLTGKFNKEYLSQLADDDHRKQNPDFQPSQFNITLELIEKLRPVAEKNGITLAQLAISWTLLRKEVTAAIVGARKPEQISETSLASNVELSSEDINQIEKLLVEYEEQKSKI